MARVSKHRPFLLSHLEVDPCRPIARGDSLKGECLVNIGTGVGS
jgi:hypothetical protein